MIQEKLNILLETNTIDQTSYDYSIQALTVLKKEEVIQEDDEADVLITHLAMATARQGSEEVVNEVDEQVREEIESSKYYDTAVELWKKLKEMAPTSFSPEEDGYIHLHLVTLLQK